MVNNQEYANVYADGVSLNTHIVNLLSERNATHRVEKKLDELING